MSSSNRHAISHYLTMLLCCFGAAVMSDPALAAQQPVTLTNTLTQIGRYSVVATAPTKGQVDLLSVTAAITVPKEIQTIGGALHWLLQDSGYRLAQETVLTDDVHAMLDLPLPAVHRRFEPMPLITVVALMVGPAFRLVQDPVHRLLAFERCDTTPSHPSIGETL